MGRLRVVDVDGQRALTIRQEDRIQLGTAQRREQFSRRVEGQLALFQINRRPLRKPRIAIGTTRFDTEVVDVFFLRLPRRIVGVLGRLDPGSRFTTTARSTRQTPGRTTRHLNERISAGGATGKFKAICNPVVGYLDPGNCGALLVGQQVNAFLQVRNKSIQGVVGING